MITPQQESEPVNPLARFVTPQAIALLLNIKVEQIKDIRLWRYVILVVAQGKTRFVSYADFPPRIGVAPPTDKDFALWRRRWKQRQRQQQKRQAPSFWIEFFAHQFDQSPSVEILHNWGRLIGEIKFAFREDMLQKLREGYRQKQLAVINEQ